MTNCPIRIALAIALLVLAPASSAFGASTTGTPALFTMLGSSSSLTHGDFVSSAEGLKSHASFFVEVPPGLPRLTVEIFDADVGRGGSAEDRAGRDRARNGSFGTSATYTLVRPDGTTAASLTCDAATCSDNAWQALLDSTTTENTAPGRWELRVQMGPGIDVNAFGIRANDGAVGAARSELNVFVRSLAGVGVNPPAMRGTATRSYALYPYVTSGC